MRCTVLATRGELRLKDFAMAMQDVYDFFHDVNVGLVERGLDDFRRS